MRSIELRDRLIGWLPKKESYRIFLQNVAY